MAVFSVVDIVEYALALLGKAELVACEILDEILIVLPCEVGLQCRILLRLLLKLAGQGGLLLPRLTEAGVHPYQLDAQKHHQRGDDQQHCGVAPALRPGFFRHDRSPPFLRGFSLS